MRSSVNARCASMLKVLLVATLVVGAADGMAAEVAAKLPADYREEIVRHELQKNPKYRDLVISYSDPVRVRIHDKVDASTAKEMTAVVFNYSPRSPDGLIYFMNVQGAALFDAGAFVRTISLDDPLLEWVDGQPQPHADTPEGKKYEIEHGFLQARQLHDPVAGPGEHRRFRRDVWLHYHPAILEMAIPAEKEPKLRELLVAREEAPFEAQFAALQRGVEPFSAAMGKAVADAKSVAERALSDFVGEAQLARLEYLRRAIGHEGMIRKEEGLDLADAGIPLSPEQMLGLAEIYEDIRNYKRNPDYKQQSDTHDPVTGLSGLNQAVLDRAARILTAEQQEIFRLFMVDRVMFDNAPSQSGRDSARLLHEPVYGPIYRRQIRRWVMANYLAPVTDMELPKAKATEVKDLLVQRDLAPREAAYEAERKGLDRPAKEAALRAATEPVVQQLKSVLGEADYQRLEGLKLFERIKGSVEQGEAAALAAEGWPLTAAQLRAFEEVYWKTHTIENPEFKTLEAMPADATTGLTALDKAFLERTTAILSERQQEVVRTYRRDVALVMRRIEENQRKRQ